MRKVICLWLTLAMAFFICAPAFPESAETDPAPVPAAEETSFEVPEASVPPQVPPAPAEESKPPVSEEPAVPAPEKIPEKSETDTNNTEPAAQEPEEPSAGQIQAGNTGNESPETEASGPRAETPGAEVPASPDTDIPAETPDVEKPGLSGETAPVETQEEEPGNETEIPADKAADDSPAGEASAADGETSAAEGDTDAPEEPAPVSQLSKAANLTLSSRELTSFTLTFTGDSAPTEYRVYRATEKKGKYKVLGSAWEPVEGSGEYRFDDLTAKKGITYYYKVRGVISGAGETRWGAYSAIVSGTTKPASVERVLGTSVSATSVRITWNAVSGATGYQIARSTKLDSGYKTLKTTSSGKTASYTDKTARLGMQYYYRVRAYYTPSGSTTKIWGPYVYSSAILCEPAAPKNFAVSGYTETSVTLSWIPATGVEYYTLVYSWTENGTARKETIDGIAPGRKSLKITGLYPGQALTFQIRSYGLTAKLDQMRSGIAECSFTIPAEPDDGNGSETGAEVPKGDPAGESGTLDEPGSPGPNGEVPVPEEEDLPAVGKDPLETAPSITDYDVTSGGVLLSWNEAPGAETYRVERSGKHNSGYKILAQGILDPGFLDTTAVTGSAYYYRVTALDGAGTEMTGAPQGVFASTALTLTSRRGSDGYYTLTWPSRKNAEQYRIYRSVNGGDFERVKTLSASSARSWKDSNVSAGHTYTYYVKAWKTADGEKVGGAKGNEKSIFVGVKENPAVTVSQAPGKITLSWEKVANASGYVIYGAKGDDELAVLARVKASATTWSQNPPAASGYLKYYVRAYALVGSKKNYAPDSDPVVIRRLAPPQIAVRRGVEVDTLEVRWSAVSGAESYRVYYKTSPEEDYRYEEASDRAVILPVQGGSTISVYVRAQCTEGEETFVGSRSTIKSITPYWKYALLIGNSQYTAKSNLQRLAMCAADVSGFSVVLNRQNGWNVNVCANLTGSEILAAISQFYSGANENCTCLFYYTGHGNMGYDGNTGSLYGIDRSSVTLAELKAALGQVPGKSIVLMDSCGSGAAVENSSGASTLDEDKYSVITAAAAYEKSYATLYYSYFTRYLAFGSGWDYASQKDLGTQPADTDKDGAVSFQEICTYVAWCLKSDDPDHRISTLTMKLPDPESSIY